MPSPSPTGRGVGVRVGTGEASVLAVHFGASTSSSPIPSLIRPSGTFSPGEKELPGGGGSGRVSQS
jgi:hypothetical protein